MEKISNIVRGNSRMASVDMKNASPVRPGVPSFGRPVGESPHPSEKMETTASKAVALQNELIDAKRGGGSERGVTQMADEFFSSRVRNPAQSEEMAPTVKVSPGKGKSNVSAMKADEVEANFDELPLHESGEISPPVGFTPRGSYVDVRV